MPTSTPPKPSFPGVAQTFASASVRTSSEEFVAVRPFHDTVATFVMEPAAVGSTVTAIGAEVAPAASVPMLHVTGPLPAQPLCETKLAPAGMASVTVTLATDALV